ncbi:MAG: NlpC/P60 family protein [Saprospiraceae bacterium]
MAFAFLAIQACLPQIQHISPAQRTCQNTGNKNPDPSGPGYNPGVSQIRTEIADYGQKFVGVNYKYGGQSPGTGFDCSGFTSYVLKGFGYTISPASAVQATTGDEVSLSRVQPGDLLWFQQKKDLNMWRLL